MSFNSETQLDDKFKVYGNFANERSACSLISLMTAYNYMQDGLNTYEKHLENITEGIINYISLRERRYISQYLSFEDLINLSTLKIDKLCEISGTTPDLVSSDILGYNQFFPKYLGCDKYCTIFLKDGSFFVVLVDNIDGRYSIRDCHQSDQHIFNYEELCCYMNSRYRMNKSTIIDGVSIPEFDNIEFIVIDKSFSLLLP